MRVFLMFAILGFYQSLFAASLAPSQSADKKIAAFMKTMSSTNNMGVLLKTMRPQMSAKGYRQVLKIVNEAPDKNKFFHFKTITNRTFAMKLKNSKWAHFEFAENGGLLIGKTLFNWANKKSIQENLDIISAIMTQEFGEQTNTALDFLIPKAHAQQKTVSVHTTNDTVAVGMATSINNWIDADVFLSRAENFCLDKPKVPKSQSLGEKKQVKLDFEEVRSQFEPQFSNFWGGTITHEAYVKFDNAQKCLRKNGYITEHDYLPIAEDEGAKAKDEAEALK
jgi:hypothetical protein